MVGVALSLCPKKNAAPPPTEERENEERDRHDPCALMGRRRPGRHVRRRSWIGGRARLSDRRRDEALPQSITLLQSSKPEPSGERIFAVKELSGAA